MTIQRITLFFNVAEVERRASSLVLPRCSNVSEANVKRGGHELFAAFDLFQRCSWGYQAAPIFYASSSSAVSHHPKGYLLSFPVILQSPFYFHNASFSHPAGNPIADTFTCGNSANRDFSLLGNVVLGLMVASR